MNFLNQIYSSKMDIKEFENRISSELSKVVEQILINKSELNVPVKKGERQGDAISKTLELEFVAE